MFEEHPDLDKRLLAKGELPTPAIPGSCALIQTVATALLLCSRPGDGLGCSLRRRGRNLRNSLPAYRSATTAVCPDHRAKTCQPLTKNKRPPNAIELGGYA